MTVTIKQQNESKVIKYIKEANACFNSGTTARSNSNIFKYDSYIYALVNNVKLPSNLNFNEKQGIISKSIVGLHNDSAIQIENIIIDDIKKEIEKQYKIFKTGKPQKFFIIIPSKIKYNSLKKRFFTVKGTKIKIRSFDHLIKNYDFKDHKTELFHEKETRPFFNSNYSYFEIEEFGRNDVKASNLGWDKFELLRSIINFSSDYRKIHHHIGRVDPISFLYPPNFFLVFDEKKEIIDQLRVIICHSQKEIDFQSHPEVLKNTQNFLSRFNAIEKGNFQDIFVSSFLLYNSVLDNYDNKWISCFNLWQVLEILTVYEDNLNYDDLIKRIISHLKNKDLVKDLISVFKEKRNKFVHGGDTSDFSYEDINMIKWITELLLIHLLFNNNFKDKQGLIYYYENLNLQRSELEKKKEMIDFIIKKMK